MMKQHDQRIIQQIIQGEIQIGILGRALTAGNLKILEVIPEKLMEYMKEFLNIQVIPAFLQTNFTIKLEGEVVTFTSFLIILTPKTPFLMKIKTF